MWPSVPSVSGGGETDDLSVVILRVDATSNTLRQERFSTFAHKIERILPVKYSLVLTQFCVLTSVQIWHRFDRRLSSMSRDLSIIASTPSVEFRKPYLVSAFAPDTASPIPVLVRV